MKIKEIILENSSYDMKKLSISDGYGAAGSDFDKVFNPESEKYASIEREKAEERSFTPVVKQDIKDDTRKKMTTKPDSNSVQSAGFRGREKAKQRAGLPHFPYQEMDLGFFKHPAP